MQKITFEDTTVLKRPYVSVNGVEYEVQEGSYDGGTDLNATTFNTMQNNIETEFTDINDILNGLKVVDSGFNLNNLITTNFYACGGATPQNSPNNTGWIGFLIVIKTYYILQMIILATGGIWTRIRYEDGTWESWHKINRDS